MSIKRAVKITLKTLAILLTAVVVLFAGLLVYLSVTEYRPAEVEELALNHGRAALAADGQHSITTFNIGYAGLDCYTDFFMDGGQMSLPRSDEAVAENLAGCGQLLAASGSEILLLQEVDRDSRRSGHRDQSQFMEQATGMDSLLALNYVCKFVPYPLPPLGSVESGICTLSAVAATAAQRVALPVPFSWPVRLANLKRCLLVSRYAIEGSERELVVVNLHLEAYDSGEGRRAQTAMLMTLLAEEYQKGNYVIAGGDFNQTFDAAPSYPATAQWQPGVLTADELPAGFSFAVNPTEPTCRALDTLYEEGNTQLYALDGFIVSDNITVSAVTVTDQSFRYSDHQPVTLTYTFAAEDFDEHNQDLK